MKNIIMAISAVTIRVIAAAEKNSKSVAEDPLKTKNFWNVMKTQTDSTKYEGQCKFCREDFSKREIAKHLDNCPNRKYNDKTKNARLRIEYPYCKNFWLIIEVDKNARFEDLDGLLRGAWLECCGHCSSFGGYGNEIGLREKVIVVAKPGVKIPYEYDFGSTTELVIETLGYSHGEIGKSGIDLAARNYLPKSDCEKCGKQATIVCPGCDKGMDVQVCKICAKKFWKKC
jgi:hypothetical protein